MTVMTSVGRTFPWLASGVLVAVLATGCSSAESDPTPPEAADKVCGGLLGKAGSAAFARLAGGPAELEPNTTFEATRPKVVAARMKRTATDTPHEEDSLRSVCAVQPSKDGEHDPDAVPMEFAFGWIRQQPSAAEVGSLLPHSIGTARADVSDQDGSVDLYFTCRLPDGVKGVVKGRWLWASNTSLSAEKERAARIRVIAAASHTMATALGCTNDLGLSPTADITHLKE